MSLLINIFIDTLIMAPKKRRKRYQYGDHNQNLLSEDNLRFIQNEIQKRFNKKFPLKTKDRDFNLPESEFLFTEEPFVVSELLALKDKLNATKSLLNDMDIEEWHQHTRRTHKAGSVVRHLREEVQAEMCTQAWAKFYEILCSYEVVPQDAKERGEMLSVHLCEAPGAFIASLNHYLGNNFPSIKWQWLGSTLNPYYEGNDLNTMLDDDTFIFKTLENWSFGLDGTGDLMRVDNLKHLKQACDRIGSVHLVTADGSISCADKPAEQEKVVGQLIFCETLAALNLLSKGGTYIFKMFTALECHMVCMMYLLCCLFDEVHIIKPATSKAGNSEVYVTCIGYARSLPTGYHEVLNAVYNPSSPTKALLPLRFIPVNFLETLKEYQHYFIGMQMDEIELNIKQFHRDMSKAEEKQLFQLKNQVALHYMRVFAVRPIKPKDRVVPMSYLDGIQRDHVSANSTNAHIGNRKTGSYNERHQGIQHDWLESVKEDEMLACKPSSCLSLKGLCQANDGTMLIPLYPEEVEWLPRGIQDNGFVCRSIVYGRKISQVRNSRFCSSIYIAKIQDAVDNASILSPAKSSELLRIVQQISGLSLSDSSEHKVCQFCKNSAAFLDKLVEFTAFERRKEDTCTRTALLLNPEGCQCQCFENYLHSKGVSVLSHSSLKVVQLDKKTSEATVGLKSIADIVVVPCYSNVSTNSFESIHVALELATKEELLLSCITAIKTLKQGGTFVCRLYNSITRFTVGLLYILHRLFNEMTIVKPVVGVLWHPERFLVCKDYKGCNEELTAHLERVSKATNECDTMKDADILEIVDMHFLYEEKFFSFVIKMNEKHTHLQLLNIARLESFYHFPGEIPAEEELVGLRQEISNYLS